METAQRSRSGTWLTSLLLASAAMLWTAIVNGGPFFFPDTTTYVRGFDAAVNAATGISTEWSDEYHRRLRLPAGDQPPTLAGRSVYYGMLLYVSDALGNLWFTALAQSLLTIVCTLLTLRALRDEASRPPSPLEFLVIACLLAAFTPVAYFNSFLIPDIFAALGLLAFAHLVIFYSRQGPWLRLFWFALLTFSLLAHSANLLLFFALTVAALTLAGSRWLAIQKGGIALATAALVLALAGELAFGIAVENATGAAPVRPPFAAARLIADGPGEAYLRENCLGSGFALCRFAGRKPINSDVLLWSANPGEGIFMAVPPAERRRVAAEQARFLRAVVADRPLEVLESSLRAISRQMRKFGLEEFNYPNYAQEIFRQNLPPAEFARVRHSAAFSGAMPVRFVELTTLPALLISLVALAVWARSSGLHRRKLTAAGGFILLVLIGILINSAVTGAVSTPHHRYQMRVIWLVPLMALAVWVRLQPRSIRSEAAPEAGAA